MFISSLIRCSSILRSSSTVLFKSTRVAFGALFRLKSKSCWTSFVALSADSLIGCRYSASACSGPILPIARS